MFLNYLPNFLLYRMSGMPKQLDGKDGEYFLDAAMQLVCSKAAPIELPEDPVGAAALRARVNEMPRMSAKPPKGVAITNLSVTGDEQTVGVRHYKPEKHDDAFVMFVHGGGWVIFTPEHYDSLCAAIADRWNVQVFSVDYRLAPEHPFPAPLDDVVDAWKALVRDKDVYGIDPGRSAVMGNSAGGNLALCLSLRLRDEGFTSPQAQILFSPVCDFVRDNESYKSHAEGRILTKPLMEWFWKMYLGDATEESLGDQVGYAAPLLAKSLEGLPTTALFGAGFDPLRSEGELLNVALRQAGVPTMYGEFSSLIHGFENMTAFTEPRRAVEEILRSIPGIFK